MLLSPKERREAAIIRQPSVLRFGTIKNLSGMLREESPEP
jgi:hypothetical protein